jgi:hypothetical protein
LTIFSFFSRVDSLFIYKGGKVVSEIPIMEILMWVGIASVSFSGAVFLYEYAGDLLYAYREGRQQSFQMKQQVLQLEAQRLEIDRRKAVALERLADELIDIEGRGLAEKIEMLGDDALIEMFQEEQIKEEVSTQ